MFYILNRCARYLPCIVLCCSAQGSAFAQQATDAEVLARGARAWADSCGRCHHIRPAGDFRDDQWRVIVYHMRVRAGLTGKEAREILRFLQASN